MMKGLERVVPVYLLGLIVFVNVRRHLLPLVGRRANTDARS